VFFKNQQLLTKTPIAATVSKDKPFQFEAQFDLRITGAVLGNFKIKPNERYFLNITHVDFIKEENITTPLAVLTADKGFVNLDLVIDEGEPVAFNVTGDAVVHLTGYFMLSDGDDDDDVLEQMQNDIFQSDSDDEDFTPGPNDSFISEDGDSDSDVEMSPKVKVLEDNEDEAAADAEKAILDKVKAKAASLSKRKEPPTSASPAAKKAKKDEEKQEEKKAEPATPKTPKGKQPNQKSPQAEKKPETPKNQATTPTKSPQNSPSINKGGLKIDILTPSTNPTSAKRGNKVTVKYIGRLQKNQKVFDQGTFEFTLGAGKVIKGWDIGLEGMPVGEKRKLTIPPKLAYGNSALDGIPANSTLEFEVTLTKVKN